MAELFMAECSRMDSGSGGARVSQGGLCLWWSMFVYMQRAGRVEALHSFPVSLEIHGIRMVRNVPMCITRTGS